MSRRLVLSFLACLALFAAVTTAGSAAAGTQLLLPQSTAFAILGHSCGGIQEQAYATGFDTSTGYPVGDVYIQTRCGGSGRGGGYKTTTYSAWVGVTWTLTGAVSSYSQLAAAPTNLNPTFSVTDAHGDQLYNQSSQAYLVVAVPAAPTGVAAPLVAGQYQVSWVPDPNTAMLISSSTVTATPVSPSSAAVVTATAIGSATSVALGPLQPLTTYQVTVVNTDAGGSSPPSAPISITTAAASTLPGAPTSVSAKWAGSSLNVTWAASVPGDSPTDQYQVTVIWRDGDVKSGPYTQNVSGSTLSVFFSPIDSSSAWKVQVRSHNAAGWGPWSATIKVSGN